MAWRLLLVAVGVLCTGLAKAQVGTNHNTNSTISVPPSFFDPFDNGTQVLLLPMMERIGPAASAATIEPFAAIGTTVGTALTTAATTASTPRNVLVVRVGFLTNTGFMVYHPCTAACALGALWDEAPFSVNALLEDASGGQFVLDKGTSTFATVNLTTTYASTLGCTVTQWADAVIGVLGWQVVQTFTFVVYLLPVQAGGGSCSRFQELAVFDCVRSGSEPCEIWLRDTGLTYWARGFGHALGRAPTAADGGNPFAGTGVWARVLPSDRHELGWGVLAVDVPGNVSTASVVLQSASLAAPDPRGGPVVQVLHAAGPDVWYLSYRTGPPARNSSGAPSLDVYLPPAFAEQVCLHTTSTVDGSQALRAVLDAAEPPPPGSGSFTSPNPHTYERFDLDFVVEVKSKNLTHARVDVSRCTRAPGLVFASQETQEGTAQPLVALSGSGLPVAVPLSFTNRDTYCAARPVFAQCVVGPKDDLPTPRIACNLIQVIIVPDINKLEQSYQVVTSTGVPILTGGFQDNSTLYCGPAGETLKAIFHDGGGDGYCCQYGGGSYWEVRIGGTYLGRGGVFTFVDTFVFQNSATWYFGTVPAGGTATVSTDVVVAPTTADTSPYQCTLVAYGEEVDPASSPVVIAVVNASAYSYSPSHTTSVSASQAPTPSATPTISRSVSMPKSVSKSRSVSKSISKTISVSKTVSKSVSKTVSKTVSNTVSKTILRTLTWAVTPTRSRSYLRSASPSLSYSHSTTRSRSVPRPRARVR